MNFTIELTASQALLEALRMLASAFGGVLPASLGEKTEKTVKPETAVPSPGAKTVPDDAPSKAVAPCGEATEEPGPVTLEFLRAAVQEKAQSGKREALRSLLGEFEVRNVSSLDPNDYEEFLKKMENL